MALREMIIDQIVQLATPAPGSYESLFSTRWYPLGQFLLQKHICIEEINNMKDKTFRKHVGALDLRTEVSKLSDEDLVQAFRITARRYYMQM